MTKSQFLFKYLLIFLLFYILHCANIQGLHFFAFGMLFSLVWCNQKIYFLVPLYILSGFLAEPILESLIVHSITCAVFLLAYFLHYKFKKPLNVWLIGLYAFLSQFGELYIASSNADRFADAILCLIFGLIMLYAYLHLLQEISLKGIRRKFPIDEIICLGIICFAVAIGIYSVPYGEYIFPGVATFSILYVCFIFGEIQSILFAIFLGLGFSFASGEYLLLSHYTFLGLSVGATKSTLKIYSVITILLIDVLSGIYFLPFYSLEHLVSTIAGASLFFLIPKKHIKSATEFVICDKEDDTVRSVINQTRNSLCNRLYELSQVFFDMKNVFFDMINGESDIKNSANALTREVILKSCVNCPNRDNCLSINHSNTNSQIANLIKIAYTRERISLVDCSPYLGANCTKLGVLINTINSVVEEYKNNLQATRNLDNGKLLLSEQMWGVSQILKSLSQEVSLNVTFDTTKERLLVEGLMYEGVVCSEAIIYFQSLENCTITLSILSKTLNPKKITQIASKIVGVPMKISKSVASPKPHFSIITMENGNNFDVVFGSARANKYGSEQSGDTFSVLNLGADKIMLALSDGMGSGTKAQKISSLALGMVENFYKAGFENELILNSVNRLLALSGEETFSALDICVINLHSGLCDIIKVGSPQSFIKSNEQIQVFDACALPLGILEELKPNIRSLVLKDNDMVIFCTDGIIDSFSNIEQLNTLLKQANTQNPQTLANLVLSEALKNYNNAPKDDMTVLIGKIYRKL